jgi:hypothetical protein
MKWALVIFVVAIATAMTGCQTLFPPASPDAETAEPLSAGIPLAPDFRISDIPVPAGFELVRAGTFVFQNPMLDVGQVRYLGKEPLSTVAQFYIDEMPRYNWKLLNIAEHNTITLYYDKADKTATILLTPKGKGSTYIDASFFPKSTKPVPSI